MVIIGIYTVIYSDSLLSSLCFYLLENGDRSQCTFASVLNLLHLAKVSDKEETQEKSADDEINLDDIFEVRKTEDPNALSVQYYTEFKQAAGETMQSILISTSVRLQCFKLAKIRNLTCECEERKNNIDLDKIGDRKTALFIIIPSSDSTYNFLAAIMYTQLFDCLYRRAIANGGRLPVHVRFICDEFANTGKIPEFEKILATCRKFEISVQVILQNLSQLKRLYEKSWEEIPGNCDTTIFLGGKDQTNNEYIMKELGKETIDTLSVNKTKSKQGSTSYNDGIMGRELMQLDELATMPNNECLVLIRGMRPFRTDKFDIEQHPRYNMLDEADSEKNTYNVTDQETEEETEILSFDTKYSDPDPDYEFDEQTAVTVYAVMEDGKKGITRTSLEKECSDRARKVFEGVSGIYSQNAQINF